MICEAFGTTPDVAERLWLHHHARTKAILDYRSARAALELLNGGREGAEKLAQQPALQQILVDLHRAQVGEDVTWEQVAMAAEGTAGDDNQHRDHH